MTRPAPGRSSGMTLIAFYVLTLTTLCLLIPVTAGLILAQRKPWTGASLAAASIGLLATALLSRGKHDPSFWAGAVIGTVGLGIAAIQILTGWA